MSDELLAGPPWIEVVAGIAVWVAGIDRRTVADRIAGPEKERLEVEERKQRPAEGDGVRSLPQCVDVHRPDVAPPAVGDGVPLPGDCAPDLRCWSGIEEGLDVAPGMTVSGKPECFRSTEGIGDVVHGVAHGVVHGVVLLAVREIVLVWGWWWERKR